MTNSVILTFAYENTNFTRKLTLEDVTDDDLVEVKELIQALNESVKAGTDNGLSDFFRADDGNKLKEISAACIRSVEITDLPILE